MWQQYFKVVKVRPGRIITPRHGSIDLSRDNLSIETLKELYEEDWPYIEITDKGREALYGELSQIFPDEGPLPDITDSDPGEPLQEENVTESPVDETPVASKRKSRAQRADSSSSY